VRQTDKVMLVTIAAFAACLLMGCPSGQISVMGEGRTVVADDGFELTVFRFTQRPAREQTPRGLALYVQGSEDQSVTGAIQSLAGFCAMNVPVVAVERRGVFPGKAVDTDVAVKFGTRDRRIADTLVALKWGIDASPPGVPVLVLGASEGGDVASAVAARCPAVTHVVLLGSAGGWTQEQEFRHFIRVHGHYLDLNSEQDLDDRVADIRAHPDADTMWAGHPYRRWSTFMFARAQEDLLRLNCPILLVHGTEDDSVPVEGARALRDAFVNAGKSNLTLVEVAGANHRFEDPATGASKLPMVEVAVIHWLGEQGVLAPEEVNVYLDRVRHKHPDLFGSPHSP
jgi:fermentation-respiration switch protein FrsA (DUF1100 family)